MRCCNIYIISASRLICAALATFRIKYPFADTKFTSSQKILWVWDGLAPGSGLGRQWCTLPRGWQLS